MAIQLKNMKGTEFVKKILKGERDFSGIKLERGFNLSGYDGFAEMNDYLKNQDLSQNQALNQKEEIMGELQKYKESCKKANPDDLLFTPPANVEFKDFSEMLKTVPSGSSDSTNTQVPNQEQIENLMQQYQNQQ